MNILIVSQHFPPDLGAVSFRMEAIYNHLISRGHNVHVLAAEPNRYSTLENFEEVKNNNSINRFKLKAKNANTISRIYGFFEFYFKSVKRYKLFQGDQIDLVISTTPYLLEGLAGQKIARKIQAYSLLDVRDLWPDTAIALGKIKANGITAKLLRILEKRAYNQADAITCTSPEYENHIHKITKIPKPTCTIYNGIDTQFINKDFSKKTNTIFDKNYLNILYAGNVGVAQNLLNLVEAAKILQKQSIHFYIIGAGSQLSDIKKYIKTYNLSNITLIKPMKRDELLKYYEEANILYLQLYSHEYFEKVVPSKIFEYLATFKPILYALEGVSKDILSFYEGTFHVEPGDSVKLANKIQNLKISTYYNRKINDLLRDTQTTKLTNFIEKTFN